MINEQLSQAALRANEQYYRALYLKHNALQNQFMDKADRFSYRLLNAELQAHGLQNTGEGETHGRTNG